MLDRIRWDDPRLEEILARYLEDFPASERKSIGQIRYLIENDWYQIHGLYDEEYLLGYAFIDVVNDTNLLWLEYFAVDKKCRGEGLGSKILEEVKKTFVGFDGIIFEIEPVTEKEPLTQKRQIFYERLGAYCISKPYILPNENGGENLWLYYLPMASDVKVKKLIATMEFLYDRVHSDIENVKKVLEHNIALLEW